MSEAFIGEIRMFAGNFPPQHWAFCDGSLLRIVQNTALYSLLGTSFGGDGKTTFGLPDLRDRVPMHWGQGPGLANRRLGESGGNASMTLTTVQMPTHSHSPGAGTSADQASPANGVWAQSSRDRVFGSGTTFVPMAAAMDPTGGGLAHENRAPYLAVSFIICVDGIYPPRP